MWNGDHPKTNSRKIERLLGLSPGYLSKILHEERIPSAELVSELALLARDPKNRLAELEEFWMSPLA